MPGRVPAEARAELPGYYEAAWALSNFSPPSNDWPRMVVGGCGGVSVPCRDEKDAMRSLALLHRLKTAKGVFGEPGLVV